MRNVICCWACGTPGNCELHHVVPEQFGGEDGPDNLVSLCVPCHDIIDRYRFRNQTIKDWYLKQATQDPGPRWARLLILESVKLISDPRWRKAVGV